MKSTYSLPSTSHTCDPRPRSSTTGPPEYTAAPRDGEFTPSMSDCCARSYQARESVRVLVESGIQNLLLLRCFSATLYTRGASSSFFHQGKMEDSACPCQPAAIDHERRSRHKRRRIASQIQHSLRDFFWLPNPAQRAFRGLSKKALTLFAQLSGFRAQHARIGIAGANAIHTNPRPMIDGHRF